MPVVTQSKKAPSKKSLHAKPSQTGRSANLVATLRQRLQLKQAVFARLLPVSVRSLATLENGTTPTEAVLRRLTELQRLTNALTEVMKKESLGKWLQNPNDAFDLASATHLSLIDR
jgi:DNA-binding transcriptional regulator YiaG